MDNNISNQNRNQNNSQNNNNMGNNFGRGQNRKSMVLCLLVALGIFLVFSLMNRQVEKARDKEISYDQFLQLLDDGQVESVTLTSDQIKIVPKKQSVSDHLSYRSDQYGYYIGTAIRKGKCKVHQKVRQFQ